MKQIKLIEKKLTNPKKGLPKEIFLFLTRISPMINVDLLIKNKKKQTLLVWRQKGEKYKEGWHIPGGIIRFQETIRDRILNTAKNELGSKVTYKTQPIFYNEIRLKQKNRSHFISLLFECKIVTGPKKNLKYIKGLPKVGQWKWHDKCPKNLIKPHSNYRKFV
jgi:ADP-ribose pyrophosphatase